ncbi:MAG: winged helix-turn-helix transcriptional regulator [Candidatus Anstonellales archaeon]
MKIDETDEFIIAEMKLNGKMKLRELAKTLDLPISTVHYRIKKLIREGILRKSVIVDWKRLNYNILGFVYLKIDGVKVDEVRKIVRELPFVENTYSLLDDYNLMLIVRAKDMEDFGQNISKIRSIIPEHSIRVVFGDER